ncbi:MAG: hypothetical protein ACYC9T_09320 [Trichloromonadaceae bacterium]
MPQPKPILPRELTGPRSYFTDIDPKDQSYDKADVARKLKLQLLTKKNIVIAASSLFHDVGFTLFSSDPGLTRALQEGIVLPAIRDEFNGIGGFFDAKGTDGYPTASGHYFISNTKCYVPWTLSENTKWFQQVFFDNLADNQSLLRSRSPISDTAASDLLGKLSNLIAMKPDGQRFLSRDDISHVAARMGEANAVYLNNFGHLIYRISGARVVNSEGHFPQSNLTNLCLAGNDRQLADARIFWELYVEAVISHITSAARLSQERIDSLSFEDILKVREGLFDIAFAETFDSLMKMAKADVNLHDPNKLLMTQEEISAISSRLATVLRERVGMELGISNDRSNNLLQLGSVVELFTGGIVFGTVGALKAIPEITSLVSPKLADAITSRVDAVKRIVASETGWNPKQQKALISGYTSLLTYGLPKNA